MAKDWVNQKLLKNAGERYIKNVAFVFWFIFIFGFILSFIFLIGWSDSRLYSAASCAINILGLIAVYYLDNLKKKGLVWLAFVLGFNIMYGLIIGRVSFVSLIMLIFILYGFKYYKILK